MKTSRGRTGNIYVAVWLIGLGILWLTDMWWPGILVLIGVSMLVRALVPGAAEVEAPAPTPAAPAVEPVPAAPAAEAEEIWAEDEDEEPAFISKPAAQTHTGHLPANCPNCGAPLAENAHKVEWSGANTAKCPFCEATLNL